MLTKSRRNDRNNKDHEVVSPDDEVTIQLSRKRFARRQHARRWLAWRRILLVVLLAGAVAGLVWLFFFSAALSVTGTTIVGSSGDRAADAELAAAVPTGGPLVLADLDAIEARVENLAFVKSADASRSWPDQVRVDVTERTPVAVVQRGTSFVALDESGVQFGGYPERPAELPVVRAGTEVGSDALAEAARVAATLPSSLAGQVDYVEVQTVDQINVQLHNGKTIRWGSAEQSDAKSRIVAVLLEEQPKAAYYDVSVPGQPILRN